MPLSERRIWRNTPRVLKEARVLLDDTDSRTIRYSNVCPGDVTGICINCGINLPVLIKYGERISRTSNSLASRIGIRKGDFDQVKGVYCSANSKPKLKTEENKIAKQAMHRIKSNKGSTQMDLKKKKKKKSEMDQCEMDVLRVGQYI